MSVTLCALVNDSNIFVSCFLSKINEKQRESGNLSYTHFIFFIRWDNGETEKLSPWDVEPIPEDGN